MKVLKARPWLPINVAVILVCVFGLMDGNSSNGPLAAVLYWIGLAASVSLGASLELGYRRKRREQQR